MLSRCRHKSCSNINNNNIIVVLCLKSSNSYKDIRDCTSPTPTTEYTDNRKEYKCRHTHQHIQVEIY